MRRNQAGTALLLGLLLLILGSTTFLLAALSRSRSALVRDRVTVDALAQAKAALIGYAAATLLTPSGAARPGDLPCPDLNDDGIGENTAGCGNGTGSSGQALRLGRLPWKDLGLADLRDGSGERLWYAVSSNFKKNTRYSGALNSDTPGTITLRDAAGNVLFNGSSAAGTGVVAVIIAPGAPLVRPTSLADSTPYRQDRSAPGTNQAINYLDLGNGEDNAGFTDGSGSDGFIAGPVMDATGQIVVNDRFAWIRSDELAPYLEKRVVAEVAQCLLIYGQANGWRYPWPAAGSLGTANAVNYADTANRRFGRVPDTPFSATVASGPSMSDHWTGCAVGSFSGWWQNWKDQVFYALADHHKPAAAAPAGNCGVAGYASPTCLSLNGQADRQFIVLAAGRRLSATGQTRSSNSQKNNAANYLEGANASDDDLFVRFTLGSSGNDTVKGAP